MDDDAADIDDSVEYVSDPDGKSSSFYKLLTLMKMTLLTRLSRMA